MPVKHSLRAAAASLAILAYANTSFAAESPIYGGPIGGTDLGGAYLPPRSGLYLAGVFAGLNAHSYGDSNRTQPNFTTDFGAAAGVGALLYEYPVRIFGGSIATTIQAGYGRRCLQLASLKSCNDGWTDIYMDAFYYSKYLGFATNDSNIAESHLAYGLTYAFGLGLTIPTGTYSEYVPASTGANTLIVSPNIAFTYLAGPKYSLWGDGTEISGRFFYSIPQENSTTHFQSGPVIDLDWAISERYGMWQLGVAGQQANQISADTLPNGNTTDTRIFAQGSIGPVASVFIPGINALLKAKILFNYDAKNTFSGPALILVFTKQLF